MRASWGIISEDRTGTVRRQRVKMSIIGITTTLKRTEDSFEFQGTVEQANGQTLAYGPVNVSEDEAGAAHKDMLDVFEMFQKEMLDHMRGERGKGEN
jgi:hypothetical protein